MGARGRRVLVILEPGRKAEALRAWVRQLLPAVAGDEAIVVDARDVDSPLSLADAIARARQGGG